MSFVDATAINLGLPYATVQRATRKLLAMLRERAPESDMQTLTSKLPDLGELEAMATPEKQLGLLLRCVHRLTSGARATRTSLQTTGLGQSDVAFVSAFAAHVRERLGEPFTQRLVASVPGLKAMSTWPVHPHIRVEEQAVGGPTAIAESTDHGQPKPPTMS